jgi:hypothetical protein
MTVQAEMDCLNKVSQHLAVEGRFVFNLPNPTCEFILASVHSAGAQFSERGRYKLTETADSLLVEQAQACNICEQTIRTKLRITRCDVDGHEIERGESAWTSRYLFPYEAIHLLYRCGFEVEVLVGDYNDGAITEKGQLIFQAKLRN